MPFRPERGSSFIQQELTRMLQSQMRDPRVLPLTITEVDLTKDLRIARVYVTSYNGEEELQEGITALISARGFLRRELAQLLHWRFTPTLEFRPDRSWEYGQKIDHLLDEIHDYDQEQGHVPEQDDEAEDLDGDD